VGASSCSRLDTLESCSLLRKRQGNGGCCSWGIHSRDGPHLPFIRLWRNVDDCEYTRCSMVRNLLLRRWKKTRCRLQRWCVFIKGRR